MVIAPAMGSLLIHILKFICVLLTSDIFYVLVISDVCVWGGGNIQDSLR